MKASDQEKILIDAYRQYLNCEEKSPKTIEKYIRDYRHFMVFLQMGEDVSMLKERLTKEMVLEYKQSLMEEYQTTSSNSMLAALNHYLEFIGRSDCRVKLLKVQRKLFYDSGRELSKQEYRKLVQEARKKGNERLALVMETICATGIRIGELHHITAETVKKGYSEVRCKGKQRTVFIPDKLQEKLRRYCHDHQIERGPVFITRSGHPVNRSNIWTEMNRLCEPAGICKEKVFPHNMRHLFARTYYEREKDIVHLADILGHSSIDTTRIYTMTSSTSYEKKINDMELIV